MNSDTPRLYPYFPKVSIVIPVYNGSNYVAEAIDSALAQTYPNLEIIVVNDGSRDEGATAAIAAGYGDKIRYIEKENGGSSTALNTGIAGMTGEWFSWLSHDDLYTPEKVERQVAYLNSLHLTEEELSQQILFAACDLIDGEGKTIHRADRKHVNEMSAHLRSLKGNEYLVAEPTRYTFHGCSCLVHKSVFEANGCFDEKLRLLNDLDLWFRIYAAGYPIHYIPEVLVKGRVHAKQVSKSIGYSYHNPEQDMFWRRSLDWLLSHHPENAELYFLFGRNAYRKTRNADGDRAFAHLISLDPSKRFKLFFLKGKYKGYASARELAKKVYLKFKT